ncbi:uncharacterized protein LOC143018947 isoform X2 [Oratosquilla oratoria]|uniref:uncharacterized protein LOC143018947 isoform X2 n=1 Tax=Oratosquilla oratoria TaxID=337810 RepID=UPI003F768926
MFAVGVHLNLVVWVFASGLLGVVVQAQSGLVATSPCECSPVCSGNVTTLDCPDGRVVPRRDCPCCTVCAQKEGEACEEPMMPCDADFGLVCSPEGLCTAEVKCTADVDCPTNRFCLGNVCVNPCPILNPCQGALKGGECVTEGHRPVCRCPSGHSRNEAGDECVSVHGANSDCEHDGRFYSVRETFYDGLCRERCVCGEGGKVTCRPISCGPGLFPAGRHSNDDFCMELRNRPGTDECCVVVACTDNSPHIVTYSPVPLSSSHREDGHRAVLRFGPQHPPPQPITEEEYQRRIKDLEATLNQGGRATASPGDTHVRSNTDVDDKSHRVRVHGTKVVDDPILLPPEPITEEEHQRRLKEKEATLNQGDRKTSSSGGAHVSGGTSQGQESAIDQTENKDQKEDAEMKPGVDMESHKVIVHGTKVVDNPILLLPEPITEEEYQRRLKEKEATLKQSNQETSSSGGAHVSSDTIDQMEESENQTQVHVQEETTVEELDEQNVPTSTQEPDQKEDAEMKPEVDEESHQVTVSGTQEVDDPSEPLIGPITEEEHQRKIKDMEATLKQSDQESASPGDAHVSSDATQAQVTDQMEESSNQTEVPPHEETTVGELDEESLSATTQSPDQEDGAETEPSVDMESHKDMASGTEMEDGMETTTEISDDAQVTLSPVETQEEEQHQMEEKEEKEESTVLLSENVPEYTATEYPAVIVEYDKEGNPIRRVTVQQSVDVVTVEPELATVSPTEESSVGVSHVQSVREGKQVPDNEALEPSHTATSTTTTTTSTTTETSGVESSTISTVLEGRSEEKQSKLGVFKVLSKNHNSTTLNLPSTRGGELYYQVLETTSGLASEAEWKKMEVIPGQVVVLLEGLMPSTSYTLKWSGKDATASKLSVTTLVGCQLSPELYVGLGDSWNNGCRTKCSCTASGNQCQPRCQFYPGSNTNPSCVEKPHPEDPECCVDYSCEGDVVVQTDKATTLETSTRVASGGLPKLIVTNKTFRSITFAWDDFRSRNYDGGYVAEYRELENEQEFEETSTPWMRQEQVRGEVSPKGEMTIDGLKPSTLYQVRVSIFDDPELERLGSSTETITIKTEMGCNYKNSSYGIGEFYNGCEERCYCNPDGSVRCKERCAIPFFKKGSYANDPHCREQPTDLDECCVLGVCSGREDNAEYDPCANIACGPNTECVPYHIEVEEKTRYGVCNCLSGYTGNPDNLETGCQFDANASGEGMAMGGCTFKNNSYKAGESFYDNCDYHCLCHENTEISCNIRCPYRMGQELSEPGCKLVPSPDDSCCAIRVCNSTINTTAEHPNSSPSQITEGCTEGNQTYAKNETFYVGCHAICTCIGYGDKSCVPRCPANKEVMDSPETQCVTLTDPKDACCTVTVCDEPKVELEVKKEISGIMENSTMVEEEKMMSHNHSHVMDDNMEKNVTLQEAMEEEMMMKNMSETNMTMEGKNMTDVMMEEEKNMTIVEGEMMHKNMTMEEDMTEKNMTMDDGMMEDTTETLMSMDDENMMEMNMTMDEQADEKNMTAEDEMMMKENGTMMMNEERHREDHALVMLEKKNRASDGFEVEITDAVAINSTAVILHVFPSKSVMQQLNASRDPSFTVLYSLDSLEWLHDRVRPTQPSMFSTDVILEVGNLEPGRTYQFRVDFEGSVSSAIKATTFDASGHEPEHRQGLPGSHLAACHVDGAIIPLGGTYERGCSEMCFCQAPGELLCRPRCPAIEMPPMTQEHNCTHVQSPRDPCCMIVDCPGGVHKGHIAGAAIGMGNKWSGQIPHPEEDVNHITHTHVKEVLSSSPDSNSHTHSNDRSHDSNPSLLPTIATDRSSEHSSGTHPTSTLNITPQPPHNQVGKTGSQNMGGQGKKGQSQESFGFTIFPRSDDANHLHDSKDTGFPVQRVQGTSTTTMAQGKEQSGGHFFNDPTRDQTHLVENEMHTISSSSSSGSDMPLDNTAISDQSGVALEHPHLVSKDKSAHGMNTLGLDTGVVHQTGQGADHLSPAGEGSQLPHPSGDETYVSDPSREHSGIPHPTGENVYLPDPTGDNAYLPNSNRANNILSDPSGGNIFLTHHGEGHLPQFVPGENEHSFPPTGNVGLAEHTGENGYLPENHFNVQPTEGNTYLPQPTGENAYLPQSAGENAYLPQPTGENAYLPQSAGENAYLPQPTGENAYLPQSAGENAYLPQPTGENTYLPDPSRENAYLPHPDDRENSYLPHSAGEHTNIADSNWDDLFLPFPSDEPHPTSENVYLPQPIGGTTVYLPETFVEVQNSSSPHTESESGLPTDPASAHHGEGGSLLAVGGEGDSDSHSATNGRADPTRPLEGTHGEQPTDMGHHFHNQIDVGDKRHTQTNTTVSMETHASEQPQHTGSDPAAHPPHPHVHDVREEGSSSLSSHGGDGGRLVQDHQVDHRHNAVATDGAPGDLQKGSVEDSSIMVQGVLLEDYDNTTMCAYNERYYKIDQEFYDGCAQFCICDSDLQVECRPIDCPKNSRDLFDADCSEWDDDAPVTLEPPRCCPEPQCKTHSSCQYMGRKFSNFEDIPRELTGCSQQCTCRYGNVSCVDLCQPVSPDPPHDLPCPSEAAVKVTLPGETCCQAWQCASHTVAEFSFSDSTPDPQTSLFPGPSDFFPLPPLSLHPSEQTSFSLGQHRPGFSQEGEIPTPEAMAIDAHSILLHFTTPSIYIGLPGKLAIKFREEAKSGEEPGEWREEVLVPSGSLVSSSVWDHPLDGLSANTMYVMQVQLNVLGASENISSPIFTVTTQAAPETTSTTEPTTTTPLPDLEINPDLYASDITKNSAKITWRDFDENEMRYIDGIQVKYTAGGKLMPHFSQMFYRDNDQIILRDLMSGTEYTVDLTFIPHEGQTSKITSNKPITFFTLPEEDPYSFEIEARLGKVTARTVELFYSGVPEPAEKYVNVFTAVYLRNDEGASSTHFKLPKYEDKKFLFVDELKPDAQYEMWIEAYLSNGRKKKSNVLTVTTKAGELPKPERSEIDPALNQEPESSGDYYGAFVAVVIIAAIACLGFLALLVVLIRKQNHAKAHINSSKNNAAYDNPSYKTYDIEMNGMKGTNGARHPEEP